MNLSSFFDPKGVLVVGVSQDPTKLGYGVARNLAHSGYRGAIHFVSPKGGILFSHPVYKSIAEVPEPVDLAVLVITAGLLPQALRECGARKIPAAIIASGGFREVGAEGAALEAECVRLARELNIRFIGPNCVGLLDTHLPIDTTFLPPPSPSQGEVAFLSHSGAICEAVIDWASGQGFGLSRLVSLGNQADLTESDFLFAVANDSHTRVLTLYLEGVKDGRHFIAEATKASRLKPIIALKVGRSASGQRAVASHTGALAGQEAAYNAAFRRAGVFRADTSEEMFDWARALAWSPLPKGRAMAILTNAGGPGAIAADALDAHGLALAELQETTLNALRVLLPPAASVHNPVDMLASASPEQYAKSLQWLLDDSRVDGVMVILPPPPMFTAESVAEAMIPVIKRSNKPVLIALMGENLIREASQRFRAHNIPDYRFPERAASALAMLVRRAQSLAEVRSAPIILSDVKPDMVRQLVQANRGDEFLDQEATARLMDAYRIPIPRIILARNAGDAASAAAMGFPVVLKIVSDDIVHKSDVGGVLLGLTDEQQVRDGFETVMRRVQTAAPDADLVGVHVQRMLPPGQEVIIGAVQDAQFGPLIMFGSGGVEVEGLKDVSFALAPLSRDDAGYLVDHTWAGRKLRGYRNVAPADREAVMEILFRLAQMAHDFPQIAEIEINPLRVFGKGAMAVDVRARLGGSHVWAASP
jgi:acetyltransferase